MIKFSKNHEQITPNQGLTMEFHAERICQYKKNPDLIKNEEYKKYLEYILQGSSRQSKLFQEAYNSKYCYEFLIDYFHRGPGIGPNRHLRVLIK